MWFGRGDQERRTLRIHLKIVFAPSAAGLKGAELGGCNVQSERIPAVSLHSSRMRRRHGAASKRLHMEQALARWRWWKARRSRSFQSPWREGERRVRPFLKLSRSFGREGSHQAMEVFEHAWGVEGQG